MEQIPLDAAPQIPSLSDAFYQELRSAIRGEAFRRGDPRYAKPFPDYFVMHLTALQLCGIFSDVQWRRQGFCFCCRMPT